MMIYSFSLHPFVLITYPFKSLAITFPPPLIYFSLHLSLLLILPLFLPNSHTMTLSRIITKEKVIEDEEDTSKHAFDIINGVMDHMEKE